MGLFIPSGPIYLCGPETYLPPRVTNLELLQRLGHKDGLQSRLAWIEARSGIKERPWANEAEATSDLAIRACENLLARFPERKEKIAQLVLATISGDYPSPPTAPLVQKALGLKGVGSYDLAAACAGFATALFPSACQALATNQDQLLVCAEIRSKFLNPADLTTAILFGDGAAALIVSPNGQGASYRLRGLWLETHGEYHDLIKVPVGGSRKPRTTEEEEAQRFIHMGQGASVFLSALEAMTTMGRQLTRALGVELSQVRWLVPHQANKLLIDQVAEQLGFCSEQLILTIPQTGNISGASSPIALQALRQTRDVNAGDLILNVSAGGGGFAAACVLEAL